MINKVYEVGIDYNKEYEVVEYNNTNSEVVFECFNGCMSAVEAETHRKDGLAGIGYAPVSFGATRALDVVKEYDEFINASDFKLGVYPVRKLQMETFWRVIGGKNQYSISNKVTTDGGSSIWVVKKGKVVIGFLLNNMTFDGQNSYFLFSNKEKEIGGTVFRQKDTVQRLFEQNKQYPSLTTGKDGKLTRFGKIAKYVVSNGETAISAWSVLESKDSRFFYGELKKHDWLTQSDKQLLKAIRKTRKPMSFDCYLESLEDRLEYLEDLVVEYESNKDSETSVLDYFDAKDEITKIEHDLVSLQEEDNSLRVDSDLDDYAW